MEKEQFPFRVKPKHQVQVRGIEYNEGQTVMMTQEEHDAFAATNPEHCGRLVSGGLFDLLMSEYNAGKIDPAGTPIPTAPEAQGQPEAGALPPLEENPHVQQ